MDALGTPAKPVVGGLSGRFYVVGGGDLLVDRVVAEAGPNTKTPPFLTGILCYFFIFFYYRIADARQKLRPHTHEAELAVTFSYKDYRQVGKKKILTIKGTEFLRRFAHHVLPRGFVRIRHYGFLASRNKPVELNMAKQELAQQKWEKQHCTWQQIATEKLGFEPERCPHCKEEGVMLVIQIINPERGPPVDKL